MTCLSVNVNKIALLRNSRGKNFPDLLAFSREILEFGAHGITVHPRPDERHAKRSDLPLLKELVTEWSRSHAPVEFNVEGYPSADFLSLLTEIRPHQATLVPDPPEALTSNAGWRVAENRQFLSSAVEQLRSAGIRVSLFIEPSNMSEADWEALKETGAQRIELYTEAFAESFAAGSQKSVVASYRLAADKAKELGLGLNAGHDLNLQNLGYLLEQIPFIDEVSIGHALITEALHMGMQATIEAYLKILR